MKGEVRIDPTFPGFVDWCRDRQLPVTVVSSGIRPLIELFLNGLQIPIYAHHVEPDPTGWRYHMLEDQEKSGIIRKACQEDQVVYVGDGASDVKVAPMVDILFARRDFYLAQYCEAENIPFIPFSNFGEIQEKLKGVVG
jgi:2-hydroxy-3-keto-5-methylthiopentenyl-1-phosphate phosphatase